ncbi:MAG: protein-glutamate O-methyltransferase CheR, partial [Gammaproteobacteria bacterium]|nr:protein-glutamate O-methyltransferase CheR [Gammaproteobacteria bacterium]
MTAGEFPQADLILCRNVMIYFTREEQEKILALFASTLPENGALVLGRSETMTGTIRNYFKSEF